MEKKVGNVLVHRNRTETTSRGVKGIFGVSRTRTCIYMTMIILFAI